MNFRCMICSLGASLFLPDLVHIIILPRETQTEISSRNIENLKITVYSDRLYSMRDPLQ